jgi:hypothetical protein
MTNEITTKLLNMFESDIYYTKNEIFERLANEGIIKNNLLGRIKGRIILKKTHYAASPNTRLDVDGIPSWSFKKSKENDKYCLDCSCGLE